MPASRRPKIPADRAGLAHGTGTSRDDGGSARHLDTLILDAEQRVGEKALLYAMMAVDGGDARDAMRALLASEDNLVAIIRARTELRDRQAKIGRRET